MAGRGQKRKKVQVSPTRKKRSQDGPMDRMLRRIQTTSEGSLLNYTHSNRANLCGQVDLDRICNLIREWVSTEEELLDEDVAYINKFFLDLVDEQDLVRLQAAMDTFYEATQTRTDGTAHWRSVYNDVASLIGNECSKVQIKTFPDKPDGE